MNSDVKEFSNALVTIKGNALRCGDSIYSIHNIVSLTFDSVKKENKRPISIDVIDFFVKLFSIYFLFGLFCIFLFAYFDNWIIKENFLDRKSIDEYVDLIILTITFAIFTAMLVGPMKDNIEKEYQNNRYYYIHGLKIIFVNNFSLFLVSSANTGFINQTTEQLYLFISKSEYSNRNELTINFSDSSINIKEAVGSNIIGGSVQGDVKNG